jgi:hypothetical protein
MQGRMLLVLLACALSSLFVIGQEPERSAGPGGKQLAIPDRTALDKAEALVRELYQEQYDKAKKDAVARAQLAALLLQEGKETNDYPAGRFVLFREARELAAQAGDAPIALQAIDELASDFGIQAAAAFQMKIKALTAASAAVAAPHAYQTIVDTALVLMEDALAADDYEAALNLTATAENAARKLKIVALVSNIRKRGEEVTALQKEFARWKPFADALRQNPKDAEASLEMGKYYALVRGNWERGLPLLAQGSDPSLKAIAAADLEEPKNGPGLVALAVAWQKLAKGSPEALKVQALLRSYYWFQQALPELDENARASVEKRMQALMDQVPPEYRVGEIVAEVRRFEAGLGPVYDVAFSPDGRKAVAGGADHALHVWDTRTGKEVRRLDGHSGRVWTVAFAPDGRRIASGGFDNTIRLWDLVSGRELRRLGSHDDYVRSVVFSTDGKRLLSGGDDRLLRLWDTTTGKELQTFKGHDHFVWSVALSRDGRRALSGGLDKTVRLWDVDSGSELKRLEGHKDTVLSVAFSPDGRRALSGSTDKTLILWDLEAGRPLQTFTGHTGYVQAVAVSPDGRRALSAGQDKSVRLWDIHTGQELRRLDGHRDQVWSVAFSRDGRWALSAGNDGVVRLWGGSR